MMQRFKGLGLVAMIVLSTVGIQATPAQAAALTTLSDVMSNVTASTAANHEIKFASPTGVAAGNTITYTFAAGFSLTGVVFGDIDFATGSSSTCSSATYTEQTLAASASGATWGAAVSGQVLTITSGTGTSTAGNCLRLRVGTNAVTGTTGTHQITNPTAGSNTITMAGTFGDTGTITVTTVSNSVVAVTATVNQTISFSISANSIAFGTLSTSAPQYANTSTGSSSDVVAHTLTAGTNSASGYSITVQGATLTSGANTITAITGSPAASAAGTAQFGLYMTASGGSGSVVTNYNGTSSQFYYGATSTTSDQVASSSGVSATTTYSAHYIANIAATTAAGSYSTNLTYVATGNF